MGTTEITGYILAIAGLGIIAFSSKIAKLLTFLGTKSLIYTAVAGIALIAVGVMLVISKSSKVKHAEEEVPIYEGHGKNRKIVGYHRA